MTDHDERPTGSSHAGYDTLTDRTEAGEEGWESPWSDNPLQRYYSWPAIHDLFPDLDGLRVLLAGCGVGDHVPEFLAGASVVGVDASERAVIVARERYGDRATFRAADLTEALSLPDDEFDLVVSHLVLDHVADWDPTLAV